MTCLPPPPPASPVQPLTQPLWHPPPQKEHAFRCAAFAGRLPWSLTNEVFALHVIRNDSRPLLINSYAPHSLFIASSTTLHNRH